VSIKNNETARRIQVIELVKDKLSETSRAELTFCERFLSLHVAINYYIKLDFVFYYFLRLDGQTVSRTHNAAY